MSTSLTGFHVIEETLRGGGKALELLISRKGRRLEELAALAKEKGVSVRRASDRELTVASGRSDHRGIVLVVDGDPARKERGLKGALSELAEETAMVLILDGVTDPHNLGAIMRSADQFAADLVIIPQRRAVHETETVARASAGANVYVPLIIAPNLAGALSLLKEEGFWIYGADMRGRKLSEVDLRGRTALVLGSEGRGLGRLLSERCDELVGIETRGHVDSLNVSVAAGIFMYETRRQQWA